MLDLAKLFCKKERGLGAALLAAAICLGLVCTAAPSVAAADSVTASIPITQKITASETDAENLTFTYTLTPEEAGSPMPAGTEEGRFSATVTGNADAVIEIPYDVPGIWYYTLSLQKPDYSALSYTSETGYRVAVQVLRESGGYTANVFAYRADGMKAKLTFEITAPGPTSSPTPIPSKSAEASSSQATALSGGESAELSASESLSASPAPSLNPSPSVKPSTSLAASGKSVNTGDDSHPGIYAGILAVSLAAMVVIALVGKKKKNA